MQVYNFPNIGYIVNTLTDEQLQPVWEEVNDIQSNFETAGTINHSEAGAIKKEYEILKSKTLLEELVLPMKEAFTECFDIPTYIQGTPFIHRAWVNFQSAGEFMAPHTHIGDYGFALYLQVPFTIQEELDYLSTPDKTANQGSSFVFYYTDSMGHIKPNFLPVDNSWENTVTFFPGEMLHGVQPFYTSDKHRITISGTIRHND
jgi:hypothetical protein|tara:strand:+ start:2722 stop:3330 length:609 start_codon:yes stop_codon:yes gene_type:complete